MVEMAPNPFKKMDLASHLTIWYYAIFNWLILYYGIMCNGGDGNPSLVWCIIFCNGGRATNPFQENGFGIPSDFLIWHLHTQLTDTILYFAVLFVLNFAMEMAPNPFQRWIWHPISLYDTLLYSIDVYYAIVMRSIFLKRIECHLHHCRI